MREGDNLGVVASGHQTERDAVLVALAHPYRRYVLEYLGEPGREATVTEVAAALGQATDTDAVAGGSPRGIDKVEATLYHVHLPKLTEVGVVEFDAQTETVRLTDRWEAVRPVLEAVEAL